MSKIALEQMTVRIIQVFDREGGTGFRLEQQVDPKTGDIHEVRVTDSKAVKAKDGEVDIDELDLSFAALVSAQPIDAIAFLKATDTDHNGKLGRAELMAMLGSLSDVQCQSLDVKLQNLEDAKAKFSHAWVEYMASNVLSRHLKRPFVKDLDHRYHEARLDFVSHLLEYAPAAHPDGSNPQASPAAS